MFYKDPELTWSNLFQNQCKQMLEQKVTSLTK